MTTVDTPAHATQTDGSESEGPPSEDTIHRLRWRIDTVDRRIAQLLARRTELALGLGRSKERSGLPLVDPAREAAVVRDAARRARESGLDEERVRQIYWCIIELSRAAQRSPEGPEAEDDATCGPRSSS